MSVHRRCVGFLSIVPLGRHSTRHVTCRTEQTLNSTFGTFDWLDLFANAFRVHYLLLCTVRLVYLTMVQHTVILALYKPMRRHVWSLSTLLLIIATRRTFRDIMSTLPAESDPAHGCQRPRPLQSPFFVTSGMNLSFFIRFCASWLPL